MEFEFSERQKELMAEVREFCMNELPEDYDPDQMMQAVWDKETVAFWRQFHLKGVEKGWPTAGWPEKYGGLGYSALDNGAITAEMYYWGARWGMTTGMSLFLVAPTILTSGTEEQKEKWIPPMVRGELNSFECFTEPDAGSDEANVQLRAVPDGDDYILNGQKTFISGALKPDWLYTLCKTADVIPKNRGLSIFMVPGDAEGVSYRPLPTMGPSMQNEIFYDNVRVPKENLLGELNRGFYLAMTTLEFERAGGGGLGIRRSMERDVEYYRQEKQNGKPTIKDPRVRKLLALQACHQHIEFLIGWEASWARDNPEAARNGVKRYGVGVGPHLQKEWRTLAYEATMPLYNLYGQLKPSSKYVRNRGRVGRSWSMSHSIHAAGSPEIRKVVLANRVLGLPRIPRQFNTMINDALQKAGQ